MAAALFPKAIATGFQGYEPAGIVHAPNFINMAKAAIADRMTESLGESYRE